MTAILSPDVWLILLAFAATANVVLAVQYTRALWSMQKETARIFRMLSIWADTWGDPPELVRQRLLADLKRTR